jgi:hypothetical protein
LLQEKASAATYKKKYNRAKDTDEKRKKLI